MLKDKFYTLCKNFIKDSKRVDFLWEEIVFRHSHKKRPYHNLAHLENIYEEFQPLTLNPTIEFSIFYHDIIYDVKNKNNEEESAFLARKRLITLKLDSKLIEKVSKLIIETKNHLPTSIENRLFLDADLAILGSKNSKYIAYTEKIREEYLIYEDALYKQGRRAVLKSFLTKERIYHSDFFYHKYEKQAQENILKEYNSLLI